jgi:hypothetical protein
MQVCRFWRTPKAKALGCACGMLARAQPVASARDCGINGRCVAVTAHVLRDLLHRGTPPPFYVYRRVVVPV